jgi:AraC-like DNA-binding protein
VRHIEFFHTDHFEYNYHRTPPASALAPFIDFFWETDFDKLWDEYPAGFSDTLFPNIGYTYIINLGTPFVMRLNNQKIDMRNDGFLPRHQAIECHHEPGNHLFGIKFRVSPILYERKINFSEYREYIFPLSYLLDQAIVSQVKKAGSFEERRNIFSNYFLSRLLMYEGSIKPVGIVLELLDHCFQRNDFTTSVETLAEKYGISSRTLQRYFEMTTGFGSKKALQIMRIRKAVAEIANAPEGFRFETYHYYDYSHFYKHLKQFLADKHTLGGLQPHLELLKRLR